MVLLSLGCFGLTFWLHFLHCILYRSTHSETMIQIASMRLCNVYIGDICYHGKSLVLTIGCNFLQWELRIKQCQWESDWVISANCWIKPTNQVLANYPWKLFILSLCQAWQRSHLFSHEYDSNFYLISFLHYADLLQPKFSGDVL